MTGDQRGGCRFIKYFGANILQIVYNIKMDVNLFRCGKGSVGRKPAVLSGATTTPDAPSCI
jgi:hypothetical protein